MENHPDQGQEANIEQTQPPFEEQQALSETDNSRETLADVKVETHDVAISLVSEYLCADRANQIAEQLRNIDRFGSETI
ncbi:MAG: hypothetical protein ACK5MU_04310 [Candidatus Saccharimonadales bacterium]